MGAVIPTITPLVAKVATNFLVSTISKNIFGKSGTTTTAYSGAFSAEEAQAGVQEASAVLVNKNSNNASLPVMYGRRRMGGTRVYVDTSNGAGDTNGTTHLNMVIAIAEGLCGWPNKIYFDEELVWDTTQGGTIVYETGSQYTSEYGNLQNYINGGLESIGGASVKIRWHVGAADPAACGLIQGSVGSGVWTANHKLCGVTYMSVVLETNPAYYEGTVPQITAEFDGKRVMPLTQTNADDYVAALDHEVFYNAAAQLSISGANGVNPVDALYEYLRNFFYGKQLDFRGTTGEWYPNLDMDLQSFVDARAYCEQIKNWGAPYGNKPLYTMNGILQTSASIFENVDMLVNSFNGMLIYTNGSFVLKMRKPDETSTFSFDRNNLLGDIELNLSGTRQRINRVAVSYANPNNQYNDDIHYVFDSASYIEDEGKLQEGKVDMPLITFIPLISALAQYKIDTSRETITVNFTAPHTAMRLECGDIIDITHDMFGWTGKLFRVIQMEILADNTIDIIAMEYDSAIEIGI